jgi:hypothetical protein
LLRILHVSAKIQMGVRNLFATRPLNSFPPSQIYPRIAKTPWKFRGLCNVVLGLWGRRGLGEFRRPRPGSAWEGSRGCGEPTWALVLDDNDHRRAARRRPAAGAAGAWAPASLGLGQGNAWVGRLREVRVEVPGQSVGLEHTRKVELAGGGNGGHSGTVLREEEQRHPFIDGRELERRFASSP